jgi:AAA domain/TrwC relaxase
MTAAYPHPRSVLKQHQRAFGGLYQSVLRAELSHRCGATFAEIVNGQAEIAGVPSELLERFSKRTAQVTEAAASKVDVFHQREGRAPSRLERAAIEREAAADTRQRKTGNGVPDLRTRWMGEAAELGITSRDLTAAIVTAGRSREPVRMPTVNGIIDDLSERRSAWHRLDVLQAVCDRLPPQPGVSGERWAAVLDRAVDRVLDACVELDPKAATTQRTSDGRSVWIEPIAPHITSARVLEQEESILSWALAVQLAEPQPSTTVDCTGLDLLQADAAAAVAGRDPLVVIVGPAGTGKTTMLRAAGADLDRHDRDLFGVAPTAKAARVLSQETGLNADTVAKLLHEWAQPGGPDAAWRLPTGTTVIVDEAGMLSTPDLFRLVEVARTERWRLALIGDPRQLQAVGRGGLFNELASTTRTVELDQVHRFTNAWEAAASLQLRHGDPRALFQYEIHDRIIPGVMTEHLETVARRWLDYHANGKTLAITTTTNEHVDAVNHAIQRERLADGQLDSDNSTIAADGTIYVGDVIVTRRNDRQLHTDRGDVVRNREYWTVTDVATDGAVTASRQHGHDSVTLPPAYTREHVHLGYAATEHGNQSATHDHALVLATAATTGRGFYVAMTRGREDNTALVITETGDSGEARDILERILATDRSDIPATTRRRELAERDRSPRLPQPRCEVPPWFAELRNDTLEELHNAEGQLNHSEATRPRLLAEVEAARLHSDQVAAATIVWLPHAPT